MWVALFDVSGKELRPLGRVRPFAGTLTFTNKTKKHLAAHGWMAFVEEKDQEPAVSRRLENWLHIAPGQTYSVPFGEVVE